MNKLGRQLALLGRKVSLNGHQRASVQLYHPSSDLKQDPGGATVVDLRSDVLTQPTPAIRQAMYEGTTGDDVFGEDPTIKALQERTAEMFGMEAALFVPSGTMGNLIAVLCHCNGRGLEALFGDMAHLIMYEQGGAAVLGGVMPRTMPQLADGTFDLDKLDEYIRPRDDPHQPWTSLICVENSHNNCGGKVLPLEWLKKLRVKADDYNLPVHMDGARALNAAVSLDVPIKEVLRHVDSVSVCMSKCIGAPVGSIVSGSAQLIAQALRLRKALGGGWRQPGPLANAVMVALDDAVPRIQKDHQNARKIAEAIMEENRGVVHIDLEGVHTNIIMVNILKDGLTARQFCDRLDTVTEQELEELGERIVVKSLPFYKYVARIVTYSSISEDQYNMACKKLQYVLRELAEK